MDTVAVALNFGSAVNFVGLLLLTRAVVKDRNVLRGFSVLGTLLTLIAVSSFNVAYYFMDNAVSFWLGLANIVFWLLAFLFTFRRYIKQRSETT